MREILFRGKRKDNDNSWIYGHLHKMDGYGTGYTEYGIQVQDIPTSRPWSVLVIPETVGQFTGLTDKNGTKIFEGDIVKREFTLWHGETKKTRETQIGVVVYSNRDCGFQVKKKCNLRKPWDGDTIEVIGNIHDNPELLESEDTE